MLGVSSDSVESHAEYVRDRNLPFRLLSDGDGAVRRRFGVKRFLGVLPGRGTLVIDRRRRVAAVCDAQVRFDQHAQNALANVSLLGMRGPDNR